MKNRIISFLLALVLLIALVPAGTITASAAQLEASFFVSKMGSAKKTPMQQSQLTASYTPPKMKATTYISESDAAATLLNGMAERNTSILIYFYTEKDPNQACVDLINGAIAHTGNPEGGDYLNLQFLNPDFGGQYYTEGTTHYLEATFTFEYITSAYQESQVDNKVSNLLNQWDLDGNTDYQKVKTIYDYMTQNIRTLTTISNNYRELSAYAALINGAAHSWGHAVTFYRLALELGLDARVIVGDSTLWNMVKVDGKWYFVDTAADAGKSTYSWFLKGTNQFYNHTIGADWLADYFPEGLPVTAEDYVYDAVKSNIVITTQPKNVTVASGKTAKVTVKAKGEGLKYQWYYKNPGKSSFSKSSVTKNTYSFEMEGAKSGRQVYCKITDAYGNTLKTKTVTMKLKGAVTITTQPKAAFAKLGAKVKTTVEAEGSGLTYAWYVSDVGDSKYFKSSIDSATYSVKMTEEKHGRKAYCVVTDKYGCSVKSKTVELRMAATITTQPKNVTVSNGTTAKVSVKAVGDDLKYQWYIKNAGQDSFSKSSITKATYSVEMSDKINGRQVYCKVTDKYGKTAKSDTVTLRKGATLKITTQPKSVTVANGSTAKVTVKASGDGLKYQWYYKNANSDSFSKSSVTSATYSVEMGSKVDGRKVYCVIKDKYGNSVKSNTVTLTMDKTLKINTQPKSVTVDNGDTAKVTVKATGSGLKYQWYVMKPGQTKFSKSSVTKATYSVEMSKSVSGRQAYCVVTDSSGKKLTTNVVTLNMTSAPKITTQPKSQAVAKGAIVEVSVKASGSGLKYQWYFKNAGQSEFSLSTNTKSTYTFRMDDSLSGRNVFCVITDSSGRKSTTKTVVISQITITAQPKTVVGEAGSTIKTTVKAEGSSLKYQWYVKNPGDDSFSKSSIDGKTYSCKITEKISGRQVYCKITDKYGNSVKTKTVRMVVE